MKKVLLSLSLITLSVSTYAQYSWTQQGTKLATSNGVNEMAIVDANTVWITAYDGSGGGTYPKSFSKTTDGTNWTAGTIAGPVSAALVGDIAAIDANTAWVVTAPSSGSNGNGIWKTTNGGSTWARQGTTTQPYNTSSFANVIHFWDANEGFTAGDPVGGVFQIFRTTNGGTTWTAVAGAPAPLAGVEYGLTGVKYVIGNNVWMGTTKGRILRSYDKGATWTAHVTPALDFGGGAAGGGVDGSSAKMAFKDANNGILIAIDNSTDAVMYSTEDGGATWEPIESTGTWFFGDITYVPGTENTYVSTGINSDAAQGTGSSYSADGGVTWTIIDNIAGVDGGQRGKVNFLNTSTGWAGFFSDGPTGSEGILKFVGTLPATSMAVADVAGKSNLKVFPNPAVDVVNLTANKEIKSVNIYDLSGKKVKSVNEGKQINVSNLAKGTYILQAYYGNGSVENTKLIKK
ncbi:T9SS type A sorting domain-containing protein [Epilithonimonas mollis]|uniref:Por secretion system C-terminal sorting domain-containing protein n=1 Tax=Epilithonimonas mollis TaxID=216903 RepID=A0A1M6R9S4_9FLAO|nr:T9SS type A sorting domain-containing protein [Epilithonimonas mollis]SHK29180.1 Por secretion system C-terminal sorting domain-containing protein [Epilithonimonas mollis]